MMGRALGDLLRVRCDDDIGRCARFDHQTELILAVIGALAKQEISHLNGAFGQLQVKESNRRALERQSNLPILSGQYSAQIELTRQLQEKLTLHSPIISQFKQFQAMSLTNLALRTAGAKVIAHSSYNNEGMHHPSHVLEDKEEKIWNSGSGLPQFITISLEEVKLNYAQIARIGFHCWHDYTTNPKTIEVEVAPSVGDKMVLWCRLTLKQKSGKQVFDITPLPASYRIIKVAIVQTFGEYETYLNQIYLFAQIEEPMHSELAVNDLQSPSNSYSKYEKEHSDQEEEEEFEENTFHNKQTYAGPQRIQSPSSKYSEQQELDHSLQNDVALLTLSKNVMEMEENIEDIKRSLEVLTVRVDMTYDKLEKKIMEKVEDLIDTKIQRMKQQIKNQLKRSSQLRDSKSQQQIDFLRSADYEQQPRPIRESKQSLHIHNLKSNRVQPKQPNPKNPVVSELMTKLAKKLQQRQLKVKKIESKRVDRPSNK